MTPRFLIKRGTRYYFSPPRYLRELGVQLERLPDDPIEARRVCEALAERADAVRLAAKRASRATKGAPATPTNLNPHTPGTVAHLIRRWAGDIDDRNTPGASPEWRRLSERTRLDYRRRRRGEADRREAAGVGAGSSVIPPAVPAVTLGPRSAAAPAEGGGPGPCDGSIQVESGDTLVAIARRCQTTVDALIKANPDIKDPRLILVGQKIALPTS